MTRVSNEQASLADKVCLITGAARGQGAAEARLFAGQGAVVHLADVSDDAGRELAEKLLGQGATGVTYHHLDVSSEEDWQQVIAAIGDSLGRLDVLVNNAGIAHRRPLLKTELADWNRVIGVNLTGMFLGIRAAAALMRDSGGGSIVNIGSMAALEGYLAGPYTPSKWGVRGLTKVAAMELADWGIRVNAVHPGLIDTPMITSVVHKRVMSELTPLGRAASPEEVALAVAFLASDDSAFITGADLPVDGGFTAGAGSRHVGTRNGYLEELQ